jgi:DNA-binding NarL/FixJ family response regulator
MITPHKLLPARREVTPRERQVWRRIACDESHKQIAAALSITHRTVNKHVCGLHQKLGTHTAVGLTREALRRGIITLDLSAP